MCTRFDDAKIAEAVDTMKAQWIHELPDGLETRVGAGGYQLTAAQAQHIALVRLALLDPPVAYPDEGLPKLEPPQPVYRSAAELAVVGRTAVVIAHRCRAKSPRRSHTRHERWPRSRERDT